MLRTANQRVEMNRVQSEFASFARGLASASSRVRIAPLSKRSGFGWPASAISSGRRKFGFASDQEPVSHSLQDAPARFPLRVVARFRCPGRSTIESREPPPATVFARALDFHSFRFQTRAFGRRQSLTQVGGLEETVFGDLTQLLRMPSFVP